MTVEEIDKRFNYHAPDDIKVTHHQKIRGNARIFAVVINEFCPDGREKALALTKIEEAMMWANAAIARSE